MDTEKGFCMKRVMILLIMLLIGCMSAIPTFATDITDEIEEENDEIIDYVKIRFNDNKNHEGQVFTVSGTVADVVDKNGNSIREKTTFAYDDIEIVNFDNTFANIQDYYENHQLEPIGFYNSDNNIELVIVPLTYDISDVDKEQLKSKEIMIVNTFDDGYLTWHEIYPHDDMTSEVAEEKAGLTQAEKEQTATDLLILLLCLCLIIFCFYVNVHDAVSDWFWTVKDKLFGKKETQHICASESVALTEEDFQEWKKEPEDKSENLTQKNKQETEQGQGDYQADNYFDLDHNTHMLICDCCGQKFIVQDKFEGYIPKCPNCGNII